MFALHVHAHRGTAAYGVYLAELDQIDAVLAELDEELVALDGTAKIATQRSVSGKQLIADLSITAAELVLVDARSFVTQDWALLDRRRSSLSHRGVLIFVTTPSSFEELMRSAPNLASWLGAQVFAYAQEGVEIAATRERRLEALRAWALKSDADVIRAAEEGTLSRDPEYAEWLVLLGRSDLLGSQEP